MQSNSIDLSRQIYALADALGPDDPATRYVRSIGLAPNDRMRFMRDAYPDFTANYHALVLPVERTGRIVGVHCTWLNDRGVSVPINRKWPRVWNCYGESGVIRFGIPEDILAICLRWEEAAYVTSRFSIPSCAAIWPWNMGRLKPPASVQRVLIYGGDDPAFDKRGRLTGGSLADEWQAAYERRGLEVESIEEGAYRAA